MDYSIYISSPQKKGNTFYNTVLKVLQSLFINFYNDNIDLFENSTNTTVLLRKFAQTDQFHGSYWSIELRYIIEELSNDHGSRELIFKLLNNYLVKSIISTDENILYSLDRRDYYLSYNSNIYPKDKKNIKVPPKKKTKTSVDRFPSQIRITNYADEIKATEHLFKIQQVESNIPLDVPKILKKLEDLGYNDWVCNSINEILVTPKQQGSYYTGSWESIYGLIYFDETDDIYLLLESLIHEASHQHFYMGEMIYSFSTDDKKKYYSSAVKTERPLRAILLAYHAFANVVIFYSSITELDWSKRYSYMKRSLAIVNQLNEHLSKNEDLTIQGQTIYNDLSSQISIINQIISEKSL